MYEIPFDTEGNSFVGFLRKMCTRRVSIAKSLFFLDVCLQCGNFHQLTANKLEGKGSNKRALKSKQSTRSSYYTRSGSLLFGSKTDE